jgi:stage V sporulation protein AE
MTNHKVQVILVTDGDRVAQKAVEQIGREIGLRCISASAGNPTPISGAEIVELLQHVPYGPVLVMFDDRGRRDKYKGEQALEYVANHPDVEVLGAVAVASNTKGCQGIEVDACVACTGKIIDTPVDKLGETEERTYPEHAVVQGDTVDVLNEVDVPVIIGVGDIGKMDKKDDIHKGAPITKRAIIEILERSGVEYGGKTKDFKGY